MTNVRQRRSTEERAELVERWQQSGLAARDFAEQASVNASSLYLWKKQLQDAATSSTAAATSSAFTELRLSSAPAHAPLIEVVARNGRIVRVPADISVQALRRVLEAVEKC